MATHLFARVETDSKSTRPRSGRNELASNHASHVVRCNSTILDSIAEVSSRRPSQLHFDEPSWRAPLDADAVIRAIPDDAKARGFLTIPMVAEAKAQGLRWVPPRERYLPFELYPLREHAQILVWHGAARFPELSLREALRKLGRGAPNALLGSTIGRVTLGSAEGVLDIVTAFAKAYEISLQPCSAHVIDHGQHHLIVSMMSVPFFLDCHHVGAFEAAMRRANVRGSVKICLTGPDSAQLLLEW